MRLTRDTALRIRNALDNYLPPVLRDARSVMSPAIRLVLKEFADDFLDFKDHAYSMTDDEFASLYDRLAPLMSLQGETDLNIRCTKEILNRIVGPSVLEVGCGRAYLAGLMAESWNVTACDIHVPDDLRARFPNVTFHRASVEELPFSPNSFDTVVCTHTLEHVRRLESAISELRRVARKQLIVVVPRERPYQYGFNLHLHFFPYRWSLESAFGESATKAEISDLGDWFYEEHTIK